MSHRVQDAAFHRACDAFARYLLPPRARLFVAHYEVLIVDAREMKTERSPVNCSFPHQTGVAERSVSGDYGCAADLVLYYVMVRYLSNRISGGLAVDLNG